MAQPRTIISTYGKLSRYNGTGADIAAGVAVTADTTKTDGIKLPAANDDPIVGITTKVIKDGEWGDLIVLPGTIVPMVAEAGGVTVGDRLMPHTNGTAKTLAAAAGTNVSLLGIAMRTAAGGATFEVHFAGPFQSRQG